MILTYCLSVVSFSSCFPFFNANSSCRGKNRCCSPNVPPLFDVGFFLCVCFSVCTAVSTLTCPPPQSELHHKLNPSVRLSCVFVKDAVYSSEEKEKKKRKQRDNMCPVIHSNDLAGLRVTVTQVFQKVPTPPLPLSLSLSLSLSLFLSLRSLPPNSNLLVFRKN